MNLSDKPMSLSFDGAIPVPPWRLFSIRSSGSERAKGRTSMEGSSSPGMTSSLSGVSLGPKLGWVREETPMGGSASSFLSRRKGQ